MYDEKAIMDIDLDADPAAGPGADMPTKAVQEVMADG